MTRGAALVFLFATAAALRRASKNRRMRSDDYVLTPANETTQALCTCQSSCGSSLAHHNRCDWCDTDNCGSWALTRGYYDFCTYTPIDGFVQLSHTEKRDALWGDISADATPGPLRNLLSAVVGTLGSSMITTFDNQRETMPAEREKVIHGQGAMVKIDMDIDSDSPYTGILGPGRHTGLVRMGSANMLDSTDGMSPGVAIKFLRSGMHSANSPLLPVTGLNTGGKEFFEVPLTNHVSPGWELNMLQKFNQASGCISMTGLSDMASYTQDGTLVAGDPKFPYEWRFVGVDTTLAALNWQAADLDSELLSRLVQIPQGTHLYNVEAKSSPDGAFQQIGTITTRSAAVSSLFGDTKLHFRHQRVEEDFRWHPEWIAKASEFPFCEESTSGSSLRPIADWQCPGVAGVGLHPRLPEA